MPLSAAVTRNSARLPHMPETTVCVDCWKRDKIPQLNHLPQGLVWEEIVSPMCVYRELVCVCVYIR